MRPRIHSRPNGLFRLSAWSWGGRRTQRLLDPFSIVLDGHGMVPMLAVSRKSFFWNKGINLMVGLAAGVVGLYFF